MKPSTIVDEQHMSLTDPEWAEGFQAPDVKGMWDLLVKEEDIQTYMRQINEDASHIYRCLQLARERSEVLAEQLGSIVCHHLSAGGTQVGSLATALFDVDQQYTKATRTVEQFNQESFPGEMLKGTAELFAENGFSCFLTGAGAGLSGSILGGPAVGLGAFIVAGSMLPLLFAKEDVWEPMIIERKYWIETSNQCIEALGESASRLGQAREEFDVQYNAVMGEEGREQ